MDHLLAFGQQPGMDEPIDVVMASQQQLQLLWQQSQQSQQQQQQQQQTPIWGLPQTPGWFAGNTRSLKSW